ncbi:MAG: SAM-dependent methyltransferase [Chloroflexota bacterium]
MSADNRAKNVKVISQHYDRFADAFDRERAYAAEGWTGPAPIMNIGYWARGATTARQAQEAFVHYAVEHLSPLAGQRVLDAGCGVAGPASILARAYGAEVDGVSIVERQVGWARQFVSAAGLAERVRIHLGSAMDLPFPEATFDVVFSLEAAHCFADKPRFLAEARRVLKPGGALLIVDLTATRREIPFSWQPALKLRLVTKADWERLLSAAGFQVEESKPIGKEIFPGYRRWLHRTAPERRERIFRRVCPADAGWPTRRAVAIRAWLTEAALCRSVLPAASQLGLREYTLLRALAPDSDRSGRG